MPEIGPPDAASSRTSKLRGSRLNTSREKSIVSISPYTPPRSVCNGTRDMGQCRHMRRGQQIQKGPSATDGDERIPQSSPPHQLARFGQGWLLAQLTNSEDWRSAYILYPGTGYDPSIFGLRPLRLGANQNY